MLLDFESVLVESCEASVAKCPVHPLNDGL
jgi:hypothetical protein